jgi:hypothetical protein
MKGTPEHGSGEAEACGASSVDRMESQAIFDQSKTNQLGHYSARARFSSETVTRAERPPFPAIIRYVSLKVLRTARLLCS